MVAVPSQFIFPYTKKERAQISVWLLRGFSPDTNPTNANATPSGEEAKTFHSLFFLFNWKKQHQVGHLCEGDEGEHSHGSKHDGGNQHDHRWADVGAEEGDGSQPATGGRNRRVSNISLLLHDIIGYYPRQRFSNCVVCVCGVCVCVCGGDGAGLCNSVGLPENSIISF